MVSPYQVVFIALVVIVLLGIIPLWLILKAIKRKDK